VKPFASLALLALAFSTPSLAKDPAPQPQSAPASGQPTDDQAKPKKPDEEKKICKFETPTGSIRPIRICKTKAQIEADREQAQSTLEEMQRMVR
jgi:hypothetical protein